MTRYAAGSTKMRYSLDFEGFKKAAADLEAALKRVQEASEKAIEQEKSKQKRHSG